MSASHHQLVAEIIGRLDASLLQAFSTLEKKLQALTNQMRVYNRSAKEQPKATDAATKSQQKFGQQLNDSGQKLSRYNQLVQKFSKDTAAGIAAARPLFKQYAKGVQEGGEALEQANRRATNMVRGLATMQNQLTQTNEGWSRWGERTRAVQIRQAELNGHIRATAQGIQILNPLALKNLNLTQAQAKAIGYYSDRNAAFHRSLMNVAQATKGSQTAFLEKEKALIKADNAIRKTGEALTRAGKNGQAFVQTANRMRIATGLANQQFTLTNGVLTPVAQRLGLVAKQGTLLQRVIGSVAESFKSMARYAAGAMIFYQLFNVFRTGIQAIIDFSQGLRDLQAIINATDDDVARLAETVKQVAADTKYSTTEVAEGMKLLGQAGLSAAEIMNSIHHVAALATGTMSDFAMVSDLVTTTVRAFQMDFRETGRVVDVFANAINRSKLTVDKLRVAFNYIAPFAHAAGIKFEEVTAGLMQLANAGIRASTMGTGFRQILIRLLNPTATFKKAIEEAGFSVDDFNPRTQDLADIFDRLSVVVPSAAEAVQFFHVRSLPAVMVFASQGGAALREFLDIIAEVGAAARMMETQTKGLGIQFKQIADKFTVLASSLGQSGLEGILLGLTTTVRKFLDVLIWLADRGFTSVIIQVVAVVAVLKTLQAAFIALSGPAIAKALFGWTAGFMGLLGHIKAVTIAVATQTGIVVTSTAAWAAFNRVLIANKFIAIATAIVAVVAAYRNFTNANETAKKRLEDQKNELRDTIDTLDLYIGKLKEAEKEGRGFNQILNRLIYELPELADEIIKVNNSGEDMGQWMKDLSAEKVTQVMAAIGQQAALSLKDIEKFGFRLSIWKSNLEEVSTVWGEIKNPINSLLKRLGFLDNAIDKNTKIVEKNKAQFREYIMEMVSYFRQQGDSFESARQRVKNVLQLAGIDLKEHGEFIEETLNFVEAAIKSLEQATIDSFRQMPKILEDLKEKHSNVADEIAKEWENTLARIDAVSKELEDGIIDDDEAQRRITAAFQELSKAVHELTGVYVHFMHASENLDRFLMGTEKGFQNLFSTLSGSEMQDFTKAVDDATEEIKELEDWLRKVRGLPDEQIKPIIDEMWARKQLEILMKFSEEFRNRYRAHLDIIREMEDRHTDLIIAGFERQVAANKRALDIRLANVQRQADQEIAVLEAGARVYAQVEAEKLHHLRQADIQKVQIIQGGVLREKQFLDQATQNYKNDIYDRVEIIRGGQLIVEKFLKDGVTAFEKAEYEKTYALKGIEDEKRRIRQEAYDQQLKLIHGHYVKEMTLVSQMEDAMIGNYDRRWEREKGYWDAKGEILGEHLDRHVQMLNTEETTTARSQAELTQIRLRTYDRYIQAHENYLNNLQGLLDKEYQHHQNVVNQIVAARQSIVDLEDRKHDELRRISREYMTEEQQLQDSRMEYERQMHNARAALAQQDYDAAKKYAEKAMSAAGEIKKEDEDRLTRQRRITDAIDLMTQAEIDRLDVLQKESEASQKRMEELEKAIMGVGDRIKEIEQTKFEVEVETITESVARAEQEINRIRERLEGEPFELSIEFDEEPVKKAEESIKEAKKAVEALDEIPVKFQGQGPEGEELNSYIDKLRNMWKSFWEEMNDRNAVVTIFYKGSGSEELPLTEKLQELKTKFDNFISHITESAEGHTVVIHFEGDYEGEKPLKETLEAVLAALNELKEEIEEPVQFQVEFVGKDGTTDSLSATFEKIEKMFQEFKEKLEEKIVTEVYVEESLKRLNELKEKIESIPKETESIHTVNVIGIDLLEKAIALHNKLNGMNTSSTHTITVRRVQASNTGGEIGFGNELRGYATGGFIPEHRFTRREGPIPGRGTKDDVPAILTRGEYVQPVSTVDYYGKGFMEALRQKAIPKESLPHFQSGGHVKDAWTYIRFMQKERRRNFFPRTYKATYGSDPNIQTKMNINIPADISESIEGRGLAGQLQAQFKEYLETYRELGLGGKKQINERHTGVIRAVNELVSSVVDRGNMSEAALKRYDFESETIIQDLHNQADFLKSQGHDDIAFKVESLAIDLEILLEEFKAKIIDLANRIQDMIISAENSARQAQSQYQSQYESLQEKLRTTREDAYKMMPFFRTTVWGGVKYRRTIPFSQSGIQSIKDIKSVQSAISALQAGARSQINVLESNTQRQVDSQGSLAKLEFKKSSLEGRKSFTEADHDLKSYMNGIIRDFRELEIKARRELQSLITRQAPKVGVSHWLNRGGFIDYMPQAKRGVDSVLAKLTPGEFVIREPIVKSLGVDFFEKLNKHGLSGFNKGGLVTNQTNIVEDTVSSGFNATVNINLGDKMFPAKMKDFDAREFVKTLKMAERRMN